MVRIYKRSYRHSRNGKNFQPYTSYRQESLEKAIMEIRTGSTTVSEAAKKYNIPKSTLSRKYRGKNSSQEKAGHPTLFTPTEEKTFIAYIKTLGDWGFPFDTLDLRVLAQKYLNKIGKTVYTLKDNMPGCDWATNFLLRNKDEISNRFAANISTDRAKLSEEVLDAFFENYIQTIDGVSPDCIINYDETNLSDDPGNKKYIYKRGTKYPERVINSSKSAISLMFSGGADGTMMPVYVVYKAEHLWDSWILGGPEKTSYNRSRSGWFDGACFEDWFNTIIVPYAKKKAGRKVIIGDNLSSHFSEAILKMCEKLNISFVCLPPKSTHILQPLDVAFYGPLKYYWRQILTEWKKLEGRKHKTLVKIAFPRLLGKLVNKLTQHDVGAKNIKAGFEKCGLFPVNPERPKSRLPQNIHEFEEEVNTVTSEVVVAMLQEMRGVTAPTDATKRKKRIEVAPGKSITADDFLQKKQAALTKGQKKSNLSKGKVSDALAENSDSDITFVMSDIEEDLDRASLSSDVIDLTEIIEPQPGPSTTRIEKEKKTIKRCRVKGKGKTSTAKSLNKTECYKPVIDKDTDALRAVWKASIKSALEKKKNLRRKDSTTSVSDIMSEHSDSDIMDVISDMSDDLDKAPEPIVESSIQTKGKGKGKKTVQKQIQDSEIIPIIQITADDPVKISSSATTVEPMVIITENENKENLSNNVISCGLNAHNNASDKDSSTIIDVRPANDDTDMVSVPGTIVPMKIAKLFVQGDEQLTYDINDKVMVRYYQKRGWKYYIGFIENIKPDKYTINFLSTVKKPELKFTARNKRIDRDVVPAISIVKKIDIVENDKRPLEFKLSNDADEVYFK